MSQILHTRIKCKELILLMFSLVSSWFNNGVRFCHSCWVPGVHYILFVPSYIAWQPTVTIKWKTAVVTDPSRNQFWVLYKYYTFIGKLLLHTNVYNYFNLPRLKSKTDWKGSHLEEKEEESLTLSLPFIFLSNYSYSNWVIRPDFFCCWLLYFHTI